LLASANCKLLSSEPTGRLPPCSKNIQVLRKQKASTNSDQIHLEDQALELHDVARLTLDGNMRGDGDRGIKAGFELALPKNLNDAVVNYMMAKQAGLGPLNLNAAFYVNREEIPIQSNVAIGIFTQWDTGLQ
jgi:hypothetical protein